ncbi:tRNA 2-thiocytidine biosynthesis protein TtcA [Ectothiorhodospira magna]|uniref:tRNA 2-thiocytidine biosynthesis protein TtcA n=1 Tax=Ectothiorhodospira magna TaxID=867345 RepID=A0A1H9AH32_9GAMM|nr:ATP-binding protein [Ectothiorhodospira magna]SEP75787.1 tRNA 2-thiocytidine biosynthesis protein TtcA [Ectothiorhodospira magna]
MQASAVQVPRSLIRDAGRAIGDFRMIRDGDRVLLGLSGGKDSLTLLHLLLYFQQRAPVRFQVGAVTIDPQTGLGDKRALMPYLQALGVPYAYVSEPILERAEKHLDNRSYCAFCSRMRRGLIYRTARQQGYNVIALGQHLDDLAESFLMSAFHGGRLKTMKAHYLIEAGDLRVIRPLVYARERRIRDFAHQAALPVMEENCPTRFGKPTQRPHMKALLAQEEQANPDLFKSLIRTLTPLMSVGLNEAIGTDALKDRVSQAK